MSSDFAHTHNAPRSSDTRNDTNQTVQGCADEEKHRSVGVFVRVVASGNSTRGGWFLFVPFALGLNLLESWLQCCVQCVLLHANVQLRAARENVWCWTVGCIVDNERHDTTERVSLNVPKRTTVPGLGPEPT